METDIEKAYREEIELSNLIKKLRKEGKYKILAGIIGGEGLIIISDISKNNEVSMQDIEEMEQWEREMKGIYLLKYDPTDRLKAINFINKYVNL